MHTWIKDIAAVIKHDVIRNRTDKKNDIKPCTFGVLVAR